MSERSSRFEKLKQYKIRNYDFSLIIMAIALTIIGIMAIGSADESLKNKQILGCVLGVITMVFVSLLDYHVLIKGYWIYYIMNLVLLGLVLVIGNTVGGATRWINILGITFQPSEAAKLLLILFYAKFIMKYKDRIKNFSFVLICLVLLAVPLLFILMEPDLSTTIMTTIIVCGILFIAGIDWKLVVAVLSVAIPTVIVVIYSALQEESIILKPYQQKRILAWLHPEDYATGESYQTLNSIMAIGSGQLLGKGYNTNEITSVLNGGFISESQTDFIFTVVGEEFGFVGSVLVVILLCLLAVDCFVIASRAQDIAGKLIASGMGFWIGFQGFLNIGVATGTLPNTGIPLPFVSSGLTSLLTVYAGLGFVLNVGLQSKKYLSYY
ncbi:MAG: rod shape-determining protein RodA [Butyrivibrio sp.]|nr:rod shape-determining protein RodA [Butyrivibrio sp.]